ncbi:MAG: GNAT family N-acetyltransferase [Anaerotignum sp.]|nr:GNAT family N-acetyltransferase [Anaerotignum sp.]
MNLHFEPITSKNRKQTEALSLFPEQVSFIESVAECLKEAEVAPEWKTVGIYGDCTLIGFAMYGYFHEPLPYGEVWLDRMLIDKKFQRKGYGKAAVLALLKKLSIEYDCNKIYLSVYDVNKPAICLYKQIGFYFNGEFDTKGERIMVYEPYGVQT